jgi:hypothetical protein
MLKYVLTFAAVLAFVSPAIAQHAHGAKGPNGGMMEDVAGVHAELVTSGNTITVNVLDEGGKPVATKGFTASALVIRGEPIQLAPASESSLKGEAKMPIEGSATVLVTLKTAAGKSGQARFKK